MSGETLMAAKKPTPPPDTSNDPMGRFPDPTSPPPPPKKYIACEPPEVVVNATRLEEEMQRLSNRIARLEELLKDR